MHRGVQLTSRSEGQPPTNDIKGTVFEHQTFPVLSLGSNPVSLAPEISALTTELLCFTDGCSHALRPAFTSENSTGVKYLNVTAPTLPQYYGKLKS